MSKKETFPCFDIAHNLMAAVELRNELGSNPESFPRNNPFASWMITIAFIFSGGLTANLLLGEPVIAPLGNTKQLLVATIIWYLVNFASDIGYKVGMSFPIKLIAGTINEMYRARKVVNGILQASQIYPNSWSIMFAIAVIRANGAGLVKPLIRLIQKTQTPKDAGFMQLSFSTKISMLAAFLLVLEKNTVFFGSFELVHLVMTLFFICVKVSSFYEIPLEKKFSMENCFTTKIFSRTRIDRTVLADTSKEKEKFKNVQKED